MIEKYKKIIIKLSFIHTSFYTKSLYFALFLYKESYNYHTAVFTDDAGQTYDSAIGIYIHQEPNSVNYFMDIISPFKILNTTTIDLKIHWLKG